MENSLTRKNGCVWFLMHYKFILQGQKFEFEHEDRHTELLELFVSQPFSVSGSPAHPGYCTGKFIIHQFPLYH